MRPFRILLSALSALLLAACARAQTPEVIYLLKMGLNQQRSSNVTALGFGVFALVEFAQPATATATLRLPSGTTRTLARDGAYSYNYIEPFLLRSQMDVAYPAGAYSIVVNGTSYALNLGAGIPNTPVIGDFAAGQSISEPANFVLRWNAFEGATATDFVGLTIESTDGEFSYASPGDDDLLPGTTQELRLALPPGKSFTGILMFIRTNQFSGARQPYTYSGAAAATEFTLRTVTPVAPPTIAAHPASLTAQVASSATLVVTAAGAGPLTYQWRHNGEPLAGATGSTLTLPSVQLFQAGTYSVTVSNAGGSVTSTGATLSALPLASGTEARLANLSTRGQAGNGSDSLIPGFVIGGTGPKRLLIRALGPALVQFGLSSVEVVADPTISLLVSGNSTPIASNDNWSASSDSAAIVSAAASVGAFALPAGSFDAALIATLQPGAYTALVAGKSIAPGIAVVEVYDLDAPGGGSRLVNIATRGIVGTGSRLLIPGFVVSGTTPRTYVIRGIGPSLSAFGIPGLLADPVLSVYQGSTLLFSNDDWSNNTAAGELVLASQRTGAFTLASGSRDSALLVTLRPGAYTFQLAGKNDTSGAALVEVYEVP